MSNKINNHPLILQYLQDLSDELTYLPDAEREQNVLEIEDHLQSLVQEKVDQGLNIDLAVKETLSNFLSVDKLAEQIISEVDIMHTVKSKQDNPKKVTNSKAYSSLILGIISILLPFVGLVFGVIGVVVSRKAKKEIINTNDGGRRLATVGLFCSVIGVIIQIFVILGYIAYSSIKIVG